MNRAGFITTSWDDGAEEDLRLAELLDKYAVAGCFYVPRTNPERAVLGASALKQLAQGFELGGHTLRHLRLTSMPIAEARREIHDCKIWLDDLTGNETRSFCYPGGLYDARHVREVQAAGFENARSASWMYLDVSPDRYQIDPSLHMYPQSALVHVAHCLRHRQLRELARYVGPFRRLERPFALGRAMLEHVVERGGVFHLWGHSWEIEAQGLWRELEELLRAMKHSGLPMLDNAQLARQLYKIT